MAVGSKSRTELTNFKELIDSNTYYVDKTKFIEEWINNFDKVTLITRPRRFGKTLMMSTIEYFLSSQTTNDAYLFDELEISKNKVFCNEYQNSAPVINVTFKDVKGNSFDDIIYMFKIVCSELYEKYEYLLNSDALRAKEKEFFINIMDENADIKDYFSCIPRLAKFLFKNIYSYGIAFKGKECKIGSR